MLTAGTRNGAPVLVFAVAVRAAVGDAAEPADVFVRFDTGEIDGLAEVPL